MKHTSFLGPLMAAMRLISGFQTSARGQSLPSGVDAMPLFPGPSFIVGLTEEIEEKTPEEPPWWSVDDWSREKKVIVLNAVTVGTIVAIGVAGWDYGSHSFRTANEGWFDPDTRYGGADKLSHVFTCYALASVYNRIYRD